MREIKKEEEWTGKEKEEEKEKGREDYLKERERWKIRIKSKGERRDSKGNRGDGARREERRRKEYMRGKEIKEERWRKRKKVMREVDRG